MAVLGVLRVRPSAEAVRDQIRTISLADQFSLSATAWPWVYAAAGAVVVLAALITVLRSDRWPRRTTRFERATAVSSAGEHPAEAWQAMDAGLDPTVDLRPYQCAESTPMCSPAPTRHNGTRLKQKHRALTQVSTVGGMRRDDEPVPVPGGRDGCLGRQ